MGCSDSKATGTENTTNRPEDKKEVANETNKLRGEEQDKNHKTTLQSRCVVLKITSSNKSPKRQFSYETSQESNFHLESA